MESWGSRGGPKQLHPRQKPSSSPCFPFEHSKNLTCAIQFYLVALLYSGNARPSPPLPERGLYLYPPLLPTDFLCKFTCKVTSKYNRKIQNGAGAGSRPSHHKDRPTHAMTAHSGSRSCDHASSGLLQAPPLTSLGGMTGVARSFKPRSTPTAKRPRQSTL